jgi:hypothetical protein
MSEEKVSIDMVVAKLRKELDRYGATGVGRGLKIKGGRVTDQECIVFFVPKKLTFSQLLSLGLEEIPKTIEGYPTDVVEVEFRVRQDDSRYRPIKGGIAGINYRERATGTLGYVSKNGDILSNNHVLALGSTEAANIAQKGDAILQPGVHGGGKYPDDKVGELDRWVVLKVTGSADGCPVGTAIADGLNAVARVLGRRGRFQYVYSTAYNRVDAAVAKATVDYEEGVMVEPGKVVKLEKPDPKPDRRLGAARAKRGRTTLFTIGTVYAVDVTVPVSGYAGNTTAYFENQVAIIGGGGEPFSLGGDSGSLVYDSNTMKPTELLFAGGHTPDGIDITLANPIEYVVEQLNFRF